MAACLFRASAHVSKRQSSCWLSSSRAASTLPGLLDEKNAQLPHRTILHSRHQEERWTVADLERHSTAMAYGLFEMKVGAGDTILAWMTNQAEHVTTILAAARLGINVVNAKDFDSEIELATAISKSNCKCIIYSGASKDVPGDGHDLLKTTIPQLVHGNALEFGPKILNVPAFPSLQYVLTTRWDKPDEGMINFKDILMYDAMTRYSPPPVGGDTPLGSAVTSPGQLSRTFTQGQLLAAAEKLSGELQLDASSKLCLTDQSLYGVALGTTIALQNTIPLVIPSELPDKSALEQAQHDEGDMVVLEPAVVDSLLL